MMRSCFPLASGIIVVAAGLLVGGGPAFAQVMSVRTEQHHDVSAAFRDAPKSAARRAVAPVKPHEAEPVRKIPLPPALKPAAEADKALQKTSRLAPLGPPATIKSHFPGLGQGVTGFAVEVAPPDTNGAVGLTQYVQSVNSSFAVFDKATGNLLAGPTDANALWKGFGGGCETNNDGDAIVLFDKLATRWVIAQFSIHGTPDMQCVAVSTTADATGTYNRYSFTYSDFDDYPKMAVWPDGYYATFNMFDNASQAFLGADACAYDRTAMLSGNAATQICFQLPATVGGMLPADFDGTVPPPAGSPNYLLYFGSNALELYKFHVDFAQPTNSTFVGPSAINVAAFTALCNGGTCIPQPGVSQQLDSLADRLMYRLAYRNFGTHESLLVNHSVAVGKAGGVRWYEVQSPGGTPSVAQQGTFAPDASFRWMGSIAMDKMGNIALAYSASSSTIKPALRYATRLAGDAINTLSNETVIVQGNGAQTGTLHRWGDYSHLSVDPVDDCTFWYTSEYLKADGTFNWSTRVTSFKINGCI